MWTAFLALLLGAAAVVAILTDRDDGRAATADGGSARSGAGGADEDKAADKDEQEPFPGTGEGTGEDLTDPSAPTDDGALPSDQAGDGDLGLSVPMTPPACDGSWVVVLGSATDPAAYEADVTTLLGSDPGAQYTLTEGACASFRQSLDDGTRIYAVYLGPFPDQAAACEVSTSVANGAYVKQMDDVTPPDQTWECRPPEIG